MVSITTLLLINLASTLSKYKIAKEYTYTASDINDFYRAYKSHTKSTKNFGLDTFITMEKGDVVYDGKVIAIDVGGSNLKMGYFDQEFVDSKTHIVKIPKDESLKRVTLFSFIADTLVAWMEQFDISSEEKYDIALTFSYPVKLNSLGSGTILGFTKDFPFAIPDLKKNNDPAKMLDRELVKRTLNMKTRVILNDTTATFAALVQEGIPCNLGVVLGTGTNGALIRNNKVINSEWGQFDSPRIKKNFLDKIVKYYLKNKTYACIDCMIGGLKLAEVIDIIFNNNASALLKKYNTCDLGVLSYGVIASIKVRVYTILAIMTVASVKGNDYIISTNGSGLSHDVDEVMYKNKIEEVHEMFKSSKIGRVELYFVQDASLRGAVHVLRYNGKIGL